MTQRERSTSGGVTELAAPPAPGPEASSRPGGTNGSSFWEQFSAAPDQLEVLHLARQQGLLDPQPRPTVHNGNGAHASPELDPLLRLLGNSAADLEPVPAKPLALTDQHLDAAQREAVARAIHSPDLFLLQGLPGTGKSRVVAEVVLQAVLRGERVLLLAPSSAAIDRVLELASGHPALCAIRCLAASEREESLAPAVRALTLTERRRHLGECARRDLARAEERCQRHAQEEAALDTLRALAEESQTLASRMTALQQKRAQPEIVDNTDEEAAAQHQHALAAFADQRDALQQRREQRHRDLAERTRLHAELRPLCLAREQGQWWTLHWWRALFVSDRAVRLAALAADCRAIEADGARLDQELAQLASDKTHAEAAFQAACRARLEAERARRQAQFDQEEAALKRAQDKLDEHWQAASRTLGEGCQPSGQTTTAVAEARAVWRRRRDRDQEQLAFSRQWIGQLDDSAGSLSLRLASRANVVAATLAGLPADRQFGDATAFDRLVLLEADQVAQSDLLSFARRARRWVFVGEPDCLDQPALGRPGDFHTLWQKLHCDPRQLTFAWIPENDRLCCRLKPLAPEQRPSLESERVADFPAIELRILVAPRLKPVLAEVVFPPSLSIAQAKQYIFRELEVLPICPSGRSLCWIDETDRVVLDLGHPAPPEAVRVTLEPGVHEIVSPAGSAAPGEGTSSSWMTCRLEFERSAGWQRSRAIEWVERHLGLRDRGRTSRLEVPHRMHPDLASFLSDFLFAGEYRVPSAPVASAPEAGPASAPSNGKVARIEFISTATQATNGSARKRGSVSSRPVLLSRKGGAGLELEMSDSRHRARLPAELRTELPEQGFVNYQEARAVVRTLEALAADPGALALSAGPRPRVAIIALYRAQVELIRRLVAQTPALATVNFDVRIDVPAGFRHQESSVVLVSLTRSHSHRAVSFGDSPSALAMALTRARSRLIIFGDPGTLARRSQWAGAVDHLDEASAACERQWVEHLVRYLEGHGPHQHTFLARSIDE